MVPMGPERWGPPLRGVGDPPQLPRRRPAARSPTSASRPTCAPPSGSATCRWRSTRSRAGRSRPSWPTASPRAACSSSATRRTAIRRPAAWASRAASRTCTTSPGSSRPSSTGTPARSCSTPTSPSAAPPSSATRSARSRTPSTTSGSSTSRSGVSHESTEEQNLASLRRLWSGKPEDAEHRSAVLARDPLAVDGVQRAQRRVRLHLRVRRDRSRRQPGAREPRRGPDLPALHPARRAAAARVDRRRGRRPAPDQGPRRARAASC